MALALFRREVQARGDRHGVALHAQDMLVRLLIARRHREREAAHRRLIRRRLHFPRVARLRHFELQEPGSRGASCQLRAEINDRNERKARAQQRRRMSGKRRREAASRGKPHCGRHLPFR